ncbi:hypothetical protein EV1_020039 [Malus domestica]
MSRVVLTQPWRTSGISRIPIPQPRKSDVAKSSHSISVDAATAVAAFGGAVVMLHPLVSFPATASLPEQVREFEQIWTKLKSPKRPFEPQHLQDQRMVFREWMQRDFSASFSLNALQDAEKALTDLYQAQ